MESCRLLAKGFSPTGEGARQRLAVPAPGVLVLKRGSSLAFRDLQSSFMDTSGQTKGSTESGVPSRQDEGWR